VTVVRRPPSAATPTTSAATFPPVALGDPMRAHGIGEVVISNAPAAAVGDLAHGQVGWQDHVVLDPVADLFELVPADLDEPHQMLGLLGLLGLTGLTA